jgi:hypothetical protein
MPTPKTRRPGPSTSPVLVAATVLTVLGTLPNGACRDGGGPSTPHDTETGDSSVPDDTSGADSCDELGEVGTRAGLLLVIGEAVVGETFQGTETIELRSDNGVGKTVCTIRQSLDSVASRGDCDECSWAFDVVWGPVAVLEDACCDEVGYDAPAIAAQKGITRSYGLCPQCFGHADMLLSFRKGDWTPLAYATWSEKSGTLGYEIEGGYVTF